ncbi:MAG: ABC-2 type transport system ATP-binding protein [Planctomycetota bacterium]|jgi:ABC-2 type transport system ATP-binding protein
MIEIRNLNKHFGPLKAVDDISFNVAKGEVLGFLGPNGAGKSTTMKMVTGFLEPTSGSISVCGHDVLSNPIRAKECIGYLPEGAPLYGDMTPRSLLKFIAEVRGIPSAQRAGRIDEVVDRVHIGGVMGQRIETLSKGFKRRVGLAQAILHDPQVLILDEPTDGLDPNQKHDVRQLILEMAKDKCIVLSTHILEEVPAVCTRAIIIARGKLQFDGTPQAMQAKSTYHNAVSVSFQAGCGVQISDMQAIEGIREARAEESSSGQPSFTLNHTDGLQAIQRVTALAGERGWQIERISIEEGRLDEVFRQITGGQAS